MRERKKLGTALKIVILILIWSFMQKCDFDFKSVMWSWFWFWFSNHFSLCDLDFDLKSLTVWSFPSLRARRLCWPLYFSDNLGVSHALYSTVLQLRLETLITDSPDWMSLLFTVMEKQTFLRFFAFFLFKKHYF